MLLILSVFRSLTWSTVRSWHLFKSSSRNSLPKTDKLRQGEEKKLTMKTNHDPARSSDSSFYLLLCTDDFNPTALLGKVKERHNTNISKCIKPNVWPVVTGCLDERVACDLKSFTLVWSLYGRDCSVWELNYSDSVWSCAEAGDSLNVKGVWFFSAVMLITRSHPELKVVFPMQ